MHGRYYDKGNGEVREELLSKGCCARKAECVGAGKPDQAGDLGEQAALADLLSRERQLRDRNSQLLVPHKSFRSVLQILDQAQVRCSPAGVASWVTPLQHGYQAVLSGTPKQRMLAT